MVDESQIKEYAEGWITERKGTGVPTFLKLAYVVVGLGALVYLVRFKQGEIANATRGALVRQLNLTTGTADTLLYGIGALALLGLVGLLIFALRKPHVD